MAAIVTTLRRRKEKLRSGNVLLSAEPSVPAPSLSSPSEPVAHPHDRLFDLGNSYSEANHRPSIAPVVRGLLAKIRSLESTNVLQSASKFSSDHKELNLQPDEAKRLAAALFVQRVFRGYQLRKLIVSIHKDAFSLSPTSVRTVVGMVRANVKGWNIFCAHLFYMLFFVLMALTQLAWSMPSNFTTHSALRDAFHGASFGVNNSGIAIGEGGIHDVHSPADALNLLGGLITSLYRGDPRFGSAAGFCGGVQYGDVDRVMHGSTPTGSACSLVTPHSGFVDSFNRYQLGLIVVQTRREVEDCGDHWNPYDKLHELTNITGRRCATNRPTIKFESSYVDVEKVKAEHKFSITAALSNTTADDMEEEEEEEDDFISMFDYVDSAGGFVGVFDVGVFNVGTDSMQVYAKNIRRWHWIDESTKTLDFNILTYNNNKDSRITTAKLHFDFTLGGHIDSFLTIESATPMTLEEQTSGIIFTFLFTICMLFRWFSTIRRAHRRGFSVRIFLEVILLLMQLSGVCFYIFAMYRSNTREMTPITPGTLDTQTGSLVRDFTELSYFVTLIQRYGYMLGLSMLGLLVQMLYLMDFNRDLSIVTRTLNRAGRDLFYFGVVYWIVVCVYALVGMFLLSGMNSKFRSYNQVINQLLLISVGEFEETRDVIFSPEQEGIHLFVTALYFWSYVFFSTLLLLNVFLSIIVDAFVGLQDQKKEQVVLSLSRGFMVWIQTTLNDILISNSCFVCSWPKPAYNGERTVEHKQVVIDQISDSGDDVEKGDGYLPSKEIKSFVNATSRRIRVIRPTSRTMERLIALCDASVPSTTTLHVRRVLGLYFDQGTTDTLVRTMQNVCRTERAVQRDSLMHGRHTGVSRQDEYLFFIVSSLQGLSRDIARLRR